MPYSIFFVLRWNIKCQIVCFYLSFHITVCMQNEEKISIRGKICVTNNPVGIPHRTRRALLRAVSFEYPLFIVVIRKRSTTAADHYLSLKTLLLKMQRIHPRPSLRLWTGSSAQMIDTIFAANTKSALGFPRTLFSVFFRSRSSQQPIF